MGEGGKSWDGERVREERRKGKEGEKGTLGSGKLGGRERKEKG